MRLTRMRERFAEQSGILVLRVNRSKVNPQLHSERGKFHNNKENASLTNRTGSYEVENRERSERWSKESKLQCVAPRAQVNIPFWAWPCLGGYPLLLKPTGSTGFTTGTGYKSRTGLWNLNIWFRYHAYAPQADFHKVRRVPGNQSEALCWAVIANGSYNIPPGRSSFPSPSTNSWGSSGKYRSGTGDTDPDRSVARVVFILPWTSGSSGWSINGSGAWSRKSRSIASDSHPGSPLLE